MTTGRRPLASALLVLLALVGGGCGGGGDGPEQLTPAQLSFGQEDYAGKLVETAGVVRRFGPEDGATRLHFVVEDADLNRIQLDGGQPERYVGVPVLVVGRFRYADNLGRHIEVNKISPVRAGSAQS